MNFKGDSHTILFIVVCVDLRIIPRTKKNLVGDNLGDVQVTALGVFLQLFECREPDYDIVIFLTQIGGGMAPLCSVRFLGDRGFDFIHFFLKLKKANHVSVSPFSTGVADFVTWIPWFKLETPSVLGCQARFL